MYLQIGYFLWIYQVNEREILKEIPAQFSQQSLEFLDFCLVCLKSCPCDLEILLPFEFNVILQPLLERLFLDCIFVQLLDNSILEILIVDDKSYKRSTKVLKHILMTALSVIRSFLRIFIITSTRSWFNRTLWDFNCFLVFVSLLVIRMRVV